MKKSDVKNFDVDDIRKLDELEAKNLILMKRKQELKLKLTA